MCGRTRDNRLRQGRSMEGIRVNRLVVVLGTAHELQGAEKRGGNRSDPLYEELLKDLVVEDELDFIFEEATGLGPTTAEKVSLALGPNRYLDVDPSREERVKFGIPENTNQPFMVGYPPDAGFADKVFHEVHAKREQLWSERIAKREFKKALMICGANHTLSFAFRLCASNFTVKAVTYMPR